MFRISHTQHGVSLIAAIFMLVGLSMMGALMTVLITAESESTVNEYFSIQALYAAESGIQASAYLINQSAIAGGGTGNCDAADTGPIQLDPAIEAWYSVESELDNASYAVSVCQITVTGMAGNSSGSPLSQREINVTYSPIVVQ